MSLLKDKLRSIKLVPVVTPYSVEGTVELAKTLVAGGVNAIEITLRTELALEATQAVKDSGIDILLDAARDYELSLLPGISGASDILLGLEYGYDFFKVFPAEAINGYELIKSLSAPFPQISFCPTGGINLTNINRYLALPSILCAGGSWILPSDEVKAGNWDKIEALCEEAMAHINSGDI